MPEARSGDLEESPRARGQGRHLGGATHAQGQGWWLGGATRGVVAAQHRRAKRSYPMLKVRNGGSKDISLIQGKEQRLCFAEAAVKRYPTPR